MSAYLTNENNAILSRNRERVNKNKDRNENKEADWKLGKLYSHNCLFYRGVGSRSRYLQRHS